VREAVEAGAEVGFEGEGLATKSRRKKMSETRVHDRRVGEVILDCHIHSWHTMTRARDLEEQVVAVAMAELIRQVLEGVVSLISFLG
jgi:hypothetical protein